MNDFDRFRHLLHSDPWTNLEELQRIVDNHQNFHAGNDGSFVAEHWTAARDVVKALREVKRCCANLARPALRPSTPGYRGQPAPLGSDGTFIDDDLPFMRLEPPGIWW